MSEGEYTSPSMRKIADVGRQKSFDKLKYTITANWIFNKWYEKIILLVVILWALYSIGRAILLW